MKTKKQIVRAAVLFAAVFAALLIAATFTDLQVSRILTKGTLPAGQYYAEGFFGTVFETIGTSPEYFVSALAMEILLVYVTRFWAKKALRTAAQAVTAAGAAILYGAWYNEMFDYIFRHYTEPRKDFVWGVIAFLAVLTAVLGTAGVIRLPDETLRKLPRFALATLAGILIATLIVQALKVPFGRMRYRAMNTIGDFSYYTRWYVANGQPDKEWMRSLFGTSDACKSFPSGHTRGAAATFYLILFASQTGVTDKRKRGALWAFALLFTGAVALSRIMVGAHFFSDVLVGGTIGFACCAAASFVCAKGSAKGSSVENS